jgi:hypothetical protein
MSWKDAVIKGGEQQILAPRLFLYAPAGTGKSTFGSRLPKPVLLDWDKGVDDVNVDRIPGPKTWEESMALVRAIAADPMGYKSLVVDTVDPLEELAIEYVLRRMGLKSLGEGKMGAAYFAVEAEWKLFLAELDIARKNGMLVCLLGHAVVREAQDPQLGTFDQFTSALSKKPWQITKRWADAILFASFDSALVENKDESRVIVTGDRFLFTERGSGFEAKNRFSLDPKLPLSWLAVEAGIARHRQSSEAVKAKILKMSAGTQFEAVAKGHLERVGDDLNLLLEIERELEKALAAPPVPQVVPAQSQAAQAVPEVAQTIPTPPTDPPRSSPETIELRIFQLAKGTSFEERAKENVTNAAKDIKTLLIIEEALITKLAEAKNGAQVSP